MALFRCGNGGLPTKTQTVTTTVTSGGSSTRANDVAFSDLAEAKGLREFSFATDAYSGSLRLCYFDFGYWNILRLGIGRNQNASTSGTCTVQAYQGNVDPTKTEAQTVNLNADTVTVTFTNTIKCIKSIATTTERFYRNITAISISGNVMTLTTKGTNSQSTTIVIYY